MTENEAPEKETAELLLLAGIEDIEKHGFQNMSMRRIAAACGVSCAAPYKHYKNRNEFLLAIINYINDNWRRIQEELLEENKGATNRELLIKISVAYIQFLVDHPNFRSIILMKDDNMSHEQIHAKMQVSRYTDEIITRYCEEVHMSTTDRKRKTFIVRSLIYGAALLMDSGELDKSDVDLLMVENSIDREFNII